MKKLLFIAAFASLLFPGTALCAKKDRSVEGNRAEKFLRRHDNDRDGAIERSEFPGKRKRFDRIDSNDDGKLNKAELDAAAPHRTRRAGKRAKKTVAAINMAHSMRIGARGPC